MPAKAVPRSGYGKDAIEVESYVRALRPPPPRHRRDGAALRQLRRPPGRDDADPLPGPARVPTAFGHDPRLQVLHEADAVEVLRRATWRTSRACSTSPAAARCCSPRPSAAPAGWPSRAAAGRDAGQRVPASHRPGRLLLGPAAVPDLRPGRRHHQARDASSATRRRSPPSRPWTRSRSAPAITPVVAPRTVRRVEEAIDRPDQRRPGAGRRSPGESGGRDDRGRTTDRGRARRSEAAGRPERAEGDLAGQPPTDAAPTAAPTAAPARRPIADRQAAAPVDPHRRADPHGAGTRAAGSTPCRPRGSERIADGLAFLRRRITGDYEVDEFGFDPDLTDHLVVPAFRPLYREVVPHRGARCAEPARRGRRRCWSPTMAARSGPWTA